MNPKEQRAREILAAPDWTDVVIENKKKFYLMTGRFNGNSYTGTRKDPVSLAQDLDKAARASVLPPRKAQAERELVIASAPVPHEPVVLVRDDVPEGEPLPDTLARLVPNDIADAQRKQWLRDRYVELGHLVNGSSTFGSPSDAVIREHEQLERYRGLFS